MRLSRIVFCFLGMTFLAQILYYYPNLPDQMASHFNSSGQPDSWMPKQNFLILEVIILVLILAEFFLLPLLLEKIPKSLVNLPNKDHWLSVENRPITFAAIRQYFEWFSVGLLFLFIAINEMVFRANLAKQPLTNSVWIILVFFLVFVTIWLLKFTFQFRKK